MVEAETTNHRGEEPVVISNRTTIMFQLDWDDEPRETFRMRCLEYEEENGGQWVLHILPNVEELESGWWRLYEIHPSRVGREYSVNTELSLRHIKALLEGAASKIGLVLREDGPFEKLCIRDLVQRVAVCVGATEESYHPEPGKKMFPAKETIGIEIYRKPDGTLIHLKEDPMPFDSTNRALWLKSFREIREAREKQRPL